VPTTTKTQTPKKLGPESASHHEQGRRVIQLPLHLCLVSRGCSSLQQAAPVALDDARQHGEEVPEGVAGPLVGAGLDVGEALGKVPGVLVL